MSVYRELSEYLKDRMREQYDPAPDGAAYDFSTIEIATTVAKEIIEILDAKAGENAHEQQE
jgi:hypothetical protein